MPDVESEAIRHIDYDDETHELVVTFITGRAYVYAGVPATVYGRFLKAESKGAFFNRHIRDRYRYTEIVALPRRP